MTIIERILTKQLEMGVFDNEEGKVSGIATRAVNLGFETLTDLQKRVLMPFLSQPCTGNIDPGGHHNGCEVVLEDDFLLDAYEEAEDFECLQCERCRTEAEHQAYDAQRFFDED